MDPSIELLGYLARLKYCYHKLRKNQLSYSSQMICISWTWENKMWKKKEEMQILPQRYILY